MRELVGLYRMRSAKDSVLSPVAVLAHQCGVTPNMITALGLVLGVTCGITIALKMVFAPALFFASIFCDVLDGTLARKFRLETEFGLMFDSVSDRATEAAIIFGAFLGGIIEPIGVVAIIGSVSLLLLRRLSYGNGLNTNYVMFGRGERLIFLMIGLFMPSVIASTACFVIAGGLGFVSSLQIIGTLASMRQSFYLKRQ